MMFLSGLLIWGLRKHPHGHPHPLEDEIHSDDPPLDPACSPGLEHRIPSSIIEDRRLLAQTWGADTPDLVVTYWLNPDGTGTGTASFQQLFLPLTNGLGEALAAMESMLFDGASEQGVPERSRLLASYCFLHLPARHDDLLIKSFFTGESLTHQFSMLDADGKMAGLRIEPDTAPEVLLGVAWIQYREALLAITREDNTSLADDALTELINRDFCFSHAHAWKGHLMAQAGAHLGDIQRRLSLALEFGDDNRLARIEQAKLLGSSAIATQALHFRQHLNSQTDHPSQGGFLLCQSLMALHQATMARALCELLLADVPGHPGATRLLRLIDQHERGAQT